MKASVDLRRTACQMPMLSMATGVWQSGEVKGHAAMKQAYEMGRQVADMSVA